MSIQRRPVRRLLATSLLGAATMAFVVVSPAAACVPEGETPSIDVLIDHAKLIAIGTTDPFPTDGRPQHLTFANVIRGPTDTRFVIPEASWSVTCDLSNLGAFVPGQRTAWVITDLDALNTSRTGYWAISPDGTIQSSWPPSGSTGITTEAELMARLKARPPDTATAPSPAQPWNTPNVMFAVGALIAGTGALFLCLRRAGR